MLTNEQRLERRKHIGSSDAAAVLGLSPWRTPREVWLEKTGRLDDSDAAPTSIAVKMGIAWEAVGVQAVADLLGVTVICSEMMIHPGGILAANFDAIGLDMLGHWVPIETKWSSNDDRWGPESAGLDGVPQEYAVQVLHQLAVCGAPRGFLGVGLVRHRGAPEHRLYEIAPPPDMVAGLIRELESWWRRHVVGDVPPDDPEPCSLDVLRRVRRTPSRTAEVDPDLVTMYHEQDAAAKRYADAAEQTKRAIIQSMGDAEVGMVGGVPVITATRQTVKGYTVAEREQTVFRWKPAAQEIAAAATGRNGGDA